METFKRKTLGRSAVGKITATRRDYIAYKSLEQIEEARDWLCELLGEQVHLGESLSGLRDGVLLCRFANAVKPGSVDKINTKTGHGFRHMENISAFLDATKAWGMKEQQLFSIPDLYENKNYVNVVNALHSISAFLQADPSYKGPLITPLENRLSFTEHVLASMSEALEDIKETCGPSIKLGSMFDPPPSKDTNKRQAAPAAVEFDFTDNSDDDYVVVVEKSGPDGENKIHIMAPWEVQREENIRKLKKMRKHASS